MDEITAADLERGRKLKTGAIAAPVAFTLVPAAITLALVFLSSAVPAVNVVILFVGIIATVIGLITGLVISGVLLQKRSVWTKDIRERMAAVGIRAEEIGWFRKELKPNEKRALKAVEAHDLLLGDAYRETLASRLTASRIIRSSYRELALARQRQNSLKRLKSARSDDFAGEVARDIGKIANINDEAKLMLAEAETRLQMIEAAATRGGTLADSELALKKLSARSSELPLALESAKMAEEIRRELEMEDV